MYTIDYVNNGSQNPPSMEHHLNLFSIAGTPNLFDAPKMSLTGMKQQDYDRIKGDGFAGLQSHIMLSPSIEKCHRSDLKISAAGIVKINNLRARAQRWKANGYSCATIMIGSGKESKREALEIAETVIRISKELAFPIYLELHRGTVTQDIKTVLHMIKAVPGLKFNGDFSHYILSYRWLETFSACTLKMISPILDRIAYLHLRPANSHHIQLAEFNEGVLELYKTLLQACFTKFIANAKPGDVLIAAPELLPKFTGFSDLIKSPLGHLDMIDRYQQSVDLKYLSQQWFNQCNHQQREIKTLRSPIHQSTNQSLLYPIVTINHIHDWQQLKSPKFKFANLIRIALGQHLQSNEEQRALMESYLEQQAKDPRICLETSRNTVTHTLQLTQELQQHYSDIKLCLNLSEWVLGEEITVEQLAATAKNIKKLRNIVATNTSYATAEHVYYGPIKYQGKSRFSLSVMTEQLYTRFYTKVWDKISAHRIDEDNQSNAVAHQAILYARQQYQKA